MRETGLTAVDKVPPQNLEAEQSVLGAVLLDNAALLTAVELIGEQDFYRDSHRRVFQAMLELFRRSEPIDLITITDYLKTKGELELVGGTAYLTSLVSSMPTAANVRYHAKIVREKAILRGLLRSVGDIAGKVYDGEFDTDELIDYAEGTIFALSERRISTPYVPLKEVIKESFQMIEHLYERKEAVTGVPTGFRRLDELTTGLQKGDLVIIGARPSVGKTAFSLNIAQHVGVGLHEPVLIFSLEMSKEQLALRMLCSEARVDSNSVRKGFIRREDWHKLTSAAGKLAEAPIFIDDSSGISVLEMRAKARRIKAEHGLSLVIVDYLQLMRGRANAESRVQEISEISRSLKALAKEMKVPVIALSQLNRSVDVRGEKKKPTLANLRESGSIEQDADVVVFLYRDEQDQREPGEQRKVFKIICDVAKQRNGPTDEVPMTFLAYCTKFEEFTDREYHEVEDDVF